MMPVINDVVEEGDETVIVRITSATNARLGAMLTSTYTIVDNDVPIISFAMSGATGFESSTYPVVQFNLSSPPKKEIKVPYTVTGTATGGGVDYILADGEFTVQAGQMSLSVPLQVIEDNLEESDETVVVTLHNPASGASVGMGASFTYTIVDNDER